MVVDLVDLAISAMRLVHNTVTNKDVQIKENAMDVKTDGLD